VKSYKIRVTFEIVNEYPDHWTPEMVEFHCNESSSCADNLLQDRLDQVKKGDACSCASSRAEVLGEVPARVATQVP
jgi:hypothetical protein